MQADSSAATCGVLGTAPTVWPLRCDTRMVNLEAAACSTIQADSLDI